MTTQNFENQMSEGDNLDAPFETARSIPRKGLEALGKVVDFNSHADWVEAKYEKFKSVASKWKDNVVETIKLNTVDKWKLMDEKEETNRLIQFKVNDIADLKGRAVTEEQNIALFESIKASDDAKFGPTVQSARDSTIREIFKRTWGEKTVHSNNNILNSRTIIEHIDQTTMQFAREIVSFQQKVSEAGVVFGEKVDNRIEKIREGNGYYERQEYLGQVNDEIQKGNVYDQYCDEKIAEYTQALSVAVEIGVSPADCKTLKNGIAEFHTKKKSAGKTMKKLYKIAEGLQDKIRKIDKKTAKYDEMKRKMGIETSVVQPNLDIPEVDESNAQDISEADGSDTLDVHDDGEQDEYDVVDETPVDNNGVDQVDEGVPTEEEQNEIPVDDLDNEVPVIDDVDKTQPNEDLTTVEEVDEEAPLSDGESVVEEEVENNSIVKTSPIKSDGSQLFSKAPTNMTIERDGGAQSDTLANETLVPKKLASSQEDALVENEEDESEEIELTEARRESANEALSNDLIHLYELLTTNNSKTDSGPKQKLKAFEMLYKTIALGNTVAEHEDAFTKEETTRLAKGFGEIKRDYNRLDMTTPADRERLKKDILNKVIRRLPDWISI
ncbi:MAG: hypothetical protein KBB54_01685 [Candidatus Pacebacteria bacterium]|nr:hypothetical protein [Candidatus Paceibacterota bacterium]MBP9818612.1 hypothetical protein [Candidatus Paceibacterota bacterium]